MEQQQDLGPDFSKHPRVPRAREGLIWGRTALIQAQASLVFILRKLSQSAERFQKMHLKSAVSMAALNCV